jgi:hypothetical protein
LLETLACIRLSFPWCVRAAARRHVEKLVQVALLIECCLLSYTVMRCIHVQRNATVTSFRLRIR